MSQNQELFAQLAEVLPCCTSVPSSVERIVREEVAQPPVEDTLGLGKLPNVSLNTDARSTVWSRLRAAYVRGNYTLLPALLVFYETNNVDKAGKSTGDYDGYIADCFAATRNTELPLHIRRRAWQAAMEVSRRATTHLSVTDIRSMIMETVRRAEISIVPSAQPYPRLHFRDAVRGMNEEQLNELRVLSPRGALALACSFRDTSIRRDFITLVADAEYADFQALLPYLNRSNVRRVLEYVADVGSGFAAAMSQLALSVAFHWLRTVPELYTEHSSGFPLVSVLVLAGKWAGDAGSAYQEQALEALMTVYESRPWGGVRAGVPGALAHMTIPERLPILREMAHDSAECGAVHSAARGALYRAQEQGECE